MIRVGPKRISRISNWGAIKIYLRRVFTMSSIPVTHLTTVTAVRNSSNSELLESCIILYYTQYPHALFTHTHGSTCEHVRAVCACVHAYNNINISKICYNSLIIVVVMY